MKRVEYLRQWREKNPEKNKIYNERHKIYMKRNRKKVSAKEKEYRHNHPEKRKIWDKNYVKNLKKEKPWQYWHYQIKARCNNISLPYKKRGVKYYLNSEILKVLWFRDKAYLLKRPSIDRIITTGNYTEDNCRFIEYAENMRRPKGVYH